MNTNRTFSVRLTAAALAAALGLASPVFASGNENHPENHTEGSNDHGTGSDDHGGSSHPENHGGGSIGQRGTTISSRLSGSIQPGARGEAKLKTNARRNQFEAEIKLPVPSSFLEITDKTGAQDATLTLSLSRLGVPYAECDFDLKNFKSAKGGVTAKYKIEIINRGGNLQERYGICDINLAAQGMQSGLPAIQAGDTAAVTIDTNGAVFLEGTF